MVVVDGVVDGGGWRLDGGWRMVDGGWWISVQLQCLMPEGDSETCGKRGCSSVTNVDHRGVSRPVCMGALAGPATDRAMGPNGPWRCVLSESLGFSAGSGPKKIGGTGSVPSPLSLDWTMQVVVQCPEPKAKLLSACSMGAWVGSARGDGDAVSRERLGWLLLRRTTPGPTRDVMWLHYRPEKRPASRFGPILAGSGLASLPWIRLGWLEVAQDGSGWLMAHGSWLRMAHGSGLRMAHGSIQTTILTACPLWTRPPHDWTSNAFSPFPTLSLSSSPTFLSLSPSNLLHPRLVLSPSNLSFPSLFLSISPPPSTRHLSLPFPPLFPPTLFRLRLTPSRFLSSSRATIDPGDLLD
jgi:hypothetical protein